jgi:hypothetical protein
VGISINTMTKEGYTHIIVPKELHGILTREAKARDVSISQYIAEVISHVQSIGDSVVPDSSINTTVNTQEKPKNGLNREITLLRRGFEPRSWAREARMLGRTTPAEHNRFRRFSMIQALYYILFFSSLSFLLQLCSCKRKGYSSSLKFCSRKVLQTLSGSPRITTLPSSIKITSCVSSRITSS